MKDRQQQEGELVALDKWYESLVNWQMARATLFDMATVTLKMKLRGGMEWLCKKKQTRGYAWKARKKCKRHRFNKNYLNIIIWRLFLHPTEISVCFYWILLVVINCFIILQLLVILFAIRLYAQISILFLKKTVFD